MRARQVCTAEAASRAAEEVAKEGLKDGLARAQVELSTRTRDEQASSQHPKLSALLDA